MLSSAMKIVFPAIINKLLGRKSPVKVGLQVTKKCNLQCEHCYLQTQTEDIHKRLSLQEIKTIIDDLKKMNISILALTGGEPLLRNDLNQIIKYSFKKRILTGVATNGTLLNEEIIFQHKKNGLAWYHLSIDGSNEEIYSKLRGKGIFEKILKTMELIYNVGVKVIATTVVTKENMNNLYEIARLVIDKKISIWSPTLVIPCGRGKEYHQESKFTKEDIIQIYETIYEINKKHKKDIEVFMMDSQIYYPFLIEKEKPGIMKKIMYRFMGGCSVIKGGTIHINSDGSIKPCAYFSGNVPDANVKHTSIIDIFQNNNFLKSLRNVKNLKGKCNKCNYIKYCGGCRSRANSISNDPFASDLYCIYK